MQAEDKKRIGGRRNSSGFTFIEVMVVAVIVVILATIAFPTYQDAVRKSRRAEGQAALMELMQQQERYYSQHNTYLAFTSASRSDNERQFKWYSGSNPASSAYELSGAACTDDSIQNCIVLKARPGTDAVNRHYRDPVCGVLTFTSTGVKGADASDCWK